MKGLQLDESDFRTAGEFIAEQMRTKSWWPRAQPHLASEQFRQMKDTPDGLSAWCDHWLDAGQKHQLKTYLRRAVASASGMRR